MLCFFQSMLLGNNNSCVKKHIYYQPALPAKDDKHPWVNTRPDMASLASVLTFCLDPLLALLYYSI